MSYALSYGDSDEYAAGQYGVGSQSYYGRDAYTVPAPAGGSSSSGGGDTSSSSSSESSDTSAASPTYAGGSSASPAPDDGSGGSGVSGLTLLVGVGAVAALSYYLFFRGGR